MKKLYWLLLLGLLGPGRLRAQAVDSLRYKLDQVSTPLDRSQVPIGLLDAYAHPLVPLAPFNGVLQDRVLLNHDLFRGLYATAYTACICGDNPFPCCKTSTPRWTRPRRPSGRPPGR